MEPHERAKCRQSAHLQLFGKSELTRPSGSSSRSWHSKPLPPGRRLVLARLCKVKSTGRARTNPAWDGILLGSGQASVERENRRCNRILLVLLSSVHLGILHCGIDPLV
ncbi:hypothetical protein CC79DRAFT_151154 [Sarocladium strictum]